jgi:peptidoglycan/LPS O-acetylase OafA/YrhL
MGFGGSEDSYRIDTLRGHTAQIDSLTSLRFFGALSVILLHLGSRKFFVSHGLEDYHVLVAGQTGIKLFFVLSGFLITSIILDEARQSGRFSFGHFFARRALRLFPLYYLAIVCLFLLHMAGLTTIPKESYLYAIFYAYNFVPRASYHGLVGSFHTLATEEHFYLVFGLLCFLVYSVARVPSWAKSAIVILILMAGIRWLPALYPWFEQYEKDYFVGRWTPLAIEPILWGCLLAYFVKSEIFTEFLEAATRTRRVRIGLHVFLLGGFLVLFLTAPFHRDGTLVTLSFCLLMADLSIYRETRLTRALQFPAFVYLGKVSYGLYVWQSVVLSTGPRGRWISSPYLAVLLVFVLAILSYELYEKRFLALKRRFR